MLAQAVQLYDENFGYCVSIVFFAACVKLLQLLKFSRRMAMLIQTLRHSRIALTNFTMMFLITYTAFCWCVASRPADNSLLHLFTVCSICCWAKVWPTIRVCC
jgi:hypothetical protein